MQREQTKPLKELIDLFIKESGLQDGLNEARILTLWDELLGASVVRATLQKRFWEGKLYIRLSSSVVRSYLFTERSRIVERMNQALGKTIITDLILQ
ncbi:MAG: DUF721 domain-containing protein [Bacteroidales bacterium]|nr:DUF721 domain-containing protein [Bacteroidales bacterium]MCL2738045.1 DUF721 domain-containing protein [Bacteroidales bacterium]